MRTITVSTDVFAAIWAQRRESEESEDAILRRLLGCPAADAQSRHDESAGSPGRDGVYDQRNDVHFRQGLEVFRVYKRKHYSAFAEDGEWRRVDTGERFLTLNRLNASIVDGAESVWNGSWRYRDEYGLNRSIEDLRRKAQERAELHE